MIKKIDEMTKEELVQALIEKTNSFYYSLTLSEKIGGFDSPLTNMRRAVWCEFDRFCSNLDIDVDSVDLIEAGA